MNDSEKKISIKDIADMAGLSVSSVSRILNHTGKHSQETADRVFKLVEEYGYTPSVMARSLKNKKTNTIGLMIPDITNEFYTKIAYYCETFLHNNGYNMFICNTLYDENIEFKYLNDFISKNVDGIIAISYLKKTPKNLYTSNIPIVILDRPSDCNSSIPNVVSDDVRGAYQATEVLINKGCRNIISVLTESSFSFINPRLVGFKKAMLDYNMEFNEETSVINILPSSESLYNSEQLISDILDERPFIDGIVCGSDRIALGALRAAGQHNLNVPHDLKIVGYDNTLYSQLSSPSISTVERNDETLSIKACELIMKMINNPEEKFFESISIPTHIVERDSTA